MFGGIGDSLKKAWYGLWILIDSLIYSLITYAYQLFNMIAKASLYNSENSDIQTMVERISIILGIGMLFVLAYNIILNIMNPDKISAGGDKSMQGIFKSAVIAIVMLTAYRMVFSYMADIQNHIMDSNVISNLILGTDNDSNKSQTDKQRGGAIAAKIFTAFFYPEYGGKVYTYESCEGESEKVCQSYRTGIKAANAGEIDKLITNDTLFDSIVAKDSKMRYRYIISSICGVIALLMFVSYVIDIGVRVAKMAFLQIIAPVPIIAYISKPSGGVFSKWLNELIKTYLSLFLRLITIYTAVFLIDLLTKSIDAGSVFANSQAVGTFVKLLGNVVLILGILLFAKDAPKLLESFLGTTFGDGGGFSPKSIAKKLSGVREAPGVGGIIGKGLDKANQGIGAAAGAAGGAWSALRNNAAMKVGNKLGLKSAKGMTHMSAGAAAKQGAAKGYAGGGGLKQFKNQGESVYTNTYGYGKKQGLFGGKSFGTQINEKYGKAYEDNVKQHAKEQNDAIRNKAIGNEIPGENDVASARMKANDYIAQNAEFAANSPIYDKASTAVEAERIAKGITYSPEERKAKINEKLSQISATTSNANEKRAIDSYLSRESVISDYQSSVLTGNKDAIDKVKIEAKNKTEAIVKAEIESKGGIKTIVSAPEIKAKLEQKVTDRINDEVNSSFTPEMEQKIRDSVANISFSNSADAEKYIQGKITAEKEKMAASIRAERGETIYESEVQSYQKELEKTMFDAKIGEVETRTMADAREAAANKIAEGVMNYEEGRIRGNHTNNADGSLDQVYNAEYETNEKIITGGVKTKTSQAETLESLGKIIDYTKKHDGKLPDINDKK